MTPAQQRTFESISADLARLARYDDESVVHDAWIRQRYDGGFAASYAPARAAAVRTAWHEAGHAVAALATGTSFSSASIRSGGTSAGRVHSVRGGGELSFVVDAAGQVAERLRDWSLPGSGGELETWLASWKGDGGDAKRFRAGAVSKFGTGRAAEAAAWRCSVELLTPLRPRIRTLARALLVYPRHLPYPVCAALEDLAKLHDALLASAAEDARPVLLAHEAPIRARFAEYVGAPFAKSPLPWGNAEPRRARPSGPDLASVTGRRCRCPQSSRRSRAFPRRRWTPWW